jgi:GNAT superfamily N-acetyltransferase
LIAGFRERSQSERNGGDPEALAAFRRESEAAFAAGLADGWLRAWLAFVDGEAVGVVVLAVYRTLPRMGGRGMPGNRLDGRIRNVRVEPAYRRRGIAAALMRAATDEAARLGVDRLALGTSTLGRPLSESLGWRAKDDEMTIGLPAPLEGAR